MLTIDQKQHIYEHLLKINCPDLLAALIADRCNSVLIFNTELISDWIDSAVYWDETEEGGEFWYNLYQNVVIIERGYEATEFVFNELEIIDIPKQQKQTKTISDYYITFKLFVANLFYRV
jgi:predicted RNA-binding protein associated with RNAse of E/G family